MGASGSKVKDVAQFCKYTKEDFQNKITIIREAHEIVQFYSSILLLETMPIKLPEYRNFSDVAEEYFNTTRKQEFPELVALNENIKNYYDFYNGLDILQLEYERSDITENQRRSKITDVFKIAYTVLQMLIEDLSESCQIQ